MSLLDRVRGAISSPVSSIFNGGRNEATRKWTTNSKENTAFRHNSAKLLSATATIPDADTSIYFLLGGTSSAFRFAPPGTGITMQPGECLLVEINAECSGDAQVAVLVIEFDQEGHRIDTKRAKPGEGLFYTSGAGVDRILVCVRCFDQGKVDIHSLKVRCGPHLMADLTQAALGPDLEVKGRSDGIAHAAMGKGSGALVIWPRSAKRICVSNVPAGNVVLSITHEDRLIAAHRKGLIARIGLIGEPMNVELAAAMGLATGDDGRAFSYMGGGRGKDGIIRQNLTFHVPSATSILAIELATPFERLVNINDVKLSRPSRRKSDDDGSVFAKEVHGWLDRTPEAQEAGFILYADINLNVVDGSSIWLSSMASILCGLGPCILVARSTPDSDIVLSNIEQSENLILVTPASLGLSRDELSVSDACIILRRLDDMLPAVRNIVIRGSAAADHLLETRQFRDRAFVYLTDFYSVRDDGLHVTLEREAQARTAVTHAAMILTQTQAIAEKLEEITGRDFDYCDVPPAIPDFELTVREAHGAGKDGPIRIGYAGKINPHWGISELLDWAQTFKAEGIELELDIVANKISNRSNGKTVPQFRERILQQMQMLGARHHASLNREQSMSLMADMDFVWCWRPPELEEHTLELSTKLVEMAAYDARCICYPNAANMEALGEGYPYFARDIDDIRQILKSDREPPAGLAAKLKSKHSLVTIRQRLQKTAFNPTDEDSGHRICFAGHDFKFVDPYMSYLKARGFEVRRDVWGWGEPVEIGKSRECQEWGETIFCEWGLANAVWHSQNLAPGKRLIIRAHLQEVNERARKFGYQINIDAVERVIFVSQRVREQAIELFGWPEEKTTVIPNFVLTDEYQFHPRPKDEIIRLGMVGIVPERKRFDRAVDLLKVLIERGHQAELQIKGPRPETLDFMHAPGRREELAYYREVYARIDSDPGLAGRVTFAPWGNDVADWYTGIDHILSCSDFESFHYALADGVLTGCHPLVWPWEEAETIYTSDWIVQDAEEAARRIEAFRAKIETDRLGILQANREFVAQRYGHETVFRALDQCCFG